MALTSQQDLFCMLYVQHRNATKAAELAGYSKRTAKQQGQRLLTRVDIGQRIAEPEDRFQDKYEAQMNRLVQELACIGLADITDVVEWGGDGGTRVQIKNLAKLPKRVTAAIAEISVTQWDVKLKMHNKIAAIELLGRHLGMFREQKESEVPEASDVANRLREALALPTKQLPNGSVDSRQGGPAN